MQQEDADTVLHEEEGTKLLTIQPPPESDIASRAIAKLDRRVLLLSLGVGFIAYVDRGNIGYAARDLCNDLNLNHQEYGMGVSQFYAGYLLTQILSNAVLKRVGAPIWLAVIMSAWGVAATGMGFMQNKTHFYILRFALGLAEGGTLPGVYYYLSLFYPDSYLSGAYSAVIAANVLSMPTSSPISAGLLSMGDALGMQGWRLLFIVEGLVPIFYAAVLYTFLPLSPESTSCLNQEEKMWIANENSKEPIGSDTSLWEDLKLIFSKRTWWFLSAAGLIGFAVQSSFMFWVTLMIDDMLYGDDDDDSKTCGSKHGSTAVAVLLTAIPYVVASALCLSARWYFNKNRSLNRSKCTAAGTGCAGLCLMSWMGTRKLSFVAGFLSLICTIGLAHAVGGVLLSLAVCQYDRSVRTTVTAVFNTSISLGPFIFPHIIGVLVDNYGYAASNIFMGLSLLLAGFLFTFVVDPLAKSKE